MSLSTLSASEALRPLVAHTADRIAHALNDLKRELDGRDGAWAHARGEIEITLASQTFVLTLVSDAHSPVTVQAQLRTPAATNGDGPMHRPRRASDAELVRDIVPRKRKVDEHGSTSTKRQRTGVGEGQDETPLITKDDLDDLLTALREDVQEDTSECVNHVQRLLRQFREEWLDQSQSDHARLQPSQSPQ
jgi:hypothetical protein